MDLDTFSPPQNLGRTRSATINMKRDELLRRTAEERRMAQWMQWELERQAAEAEAYLDR